MIVLSLVVMVVYMCESLLRLPDVIARTGLCRSVIYKLQKEGKFPKSHKLTARSVAWKSSDIDAFISSICS